MRFHHFPSKSKLQLRSCLYFIALSFIISSCNSCPKKPQPVKDLCTIIGPWQPRHEMIGEGKFLWDSTVISVKFMDDRFTMKDQVINWANEWSGFTGRTFVRSYANDADIRVSFLSEGLSSAIGKNAHNVNKASPTMSLHHLWEYDDQKQRAIVLHEFGHALGLIHELQHPEIKIKWNRPVLFAYYKNTYKRDSGWVKEQIIDPYSTTTSIRCELDLKSIMMYEIPKGLTIDTTYEIPAPTDLSSNDKKFIKMIYQKKQCN